ncbi:MAG: hypothetical protein COS85_23145 [Armatimonadetes bacterium CG07_land_8_20_14_0_80_59_28]|nr:MAG: hypothetical protein COS85_23145 [Armatimonadetes bacterium CG07_land_8_20_14_0_80_59_28]PIX38816.1 MAG: hypothetical protein COZ56_19415 [Armatimonadetes bacterium CG_4_8_14_3_um_filter_58_9]
MSVNVPDSLVQEMVREFKDMRFEHTMGSLDTLMEGVNSPGAAMVARDHLDGGADVAWARVRAKYASRFGADWPQVERLLAKKLRDDIVRQLR